MSKPHQPSRSRRLLPPIAGLTAFEAVARTASFTAAASELSLSQSAVSREIKALEGRLGVTLFHRTNQRVTLTTAGVSYSQRVRVLLEDLASATSELIGVRSQGGILRLGILPTFGARWLLPEMPDFFAQHPTIEVRFVNRTQGPFDFERENLDAAICADFYEWPSAQLLKLIDQAMIPVAAPKVAMKMREPTDLVSATLLAYSEHREMWSEWFAHASIQMNSNQRTITFETYQMVFQAATVGLGVAIVPFMLAERELAAGDLVTLFGPPMNYGKGIYLAYPKAKERHPPLATFRDWILAVANRRREASKENPSSE